MQNTATKAARLLRKEIQFQKCQTQNTQLDTLRAATNISQQLPYQKETSFVLIKLTSNTSSAKTATNLITRVSVHVIL
jgi:hypothetical protein